MSDVKDIIRRSYDRLSDAFFDHFCTKGIHNPRFEELFGILDRSLPPGSKALDLGCGAGIPFTRRLSEHFAVTGIDFSQVQIERAQRNLPGVEFQCRDIADLEFPPDLGSCLYALFHLPVAEQKDLIGNVARWLRGGGYAAFVYTNREEGGHGKEDGWLGAEMHWMHLPRGEYESLLKEAGFETEYEFEAEEDGELAWRVVLVRKKR